MSRERLVLPRIPPYAIFGGSILQSNGGAEDLQRFANSKGNAMGYAQAYVAESKEGCWSHVYDLHHRRIIFRVEWPYGAKTAVSTIIDGT